MCNKDGNEAITISDFDKQRNQFKRSPNWSDIEIETLCNFVREHEQNLFMQMGDQKKVNANKAKHWELAANEINAIASTHRHWRQVRKKWKDLVYCTKNCNKKAMVVDETLGVEMYEKNNGNLQQDAANTSMPNIDVIGNTSNIMTSNSSDTSYSTTPSELSPISTPISSDVSGKEGPDVCTIHETCESPMILKTSKFPPYSNVSKRISPTHTFERRMVCENQYQITNGMLPAVKQYRPAAKRQKLPDSGKPLNKEVQESSMSAYERARLRIEEEKLIVQKSTLNYLHDVCQGMKRVTSAISKLKRKRKSSKKEPLFKRGHYVRAWTPESYSDTSEDDF